MTVTRKTLAMMMMTTGALLGANPGVLGAEGPQLRIGWGAADITPDRPAVLGGMTWARITDGVLDPLTATALALEREVPGQPQDYVILVSCDLRSIQDALRDGVRQTLRSRLPALDPMRVVLNATHTHSAPPLGEFGIKLEGMSEDEYIALAVPRIAAAAEQAWTGRRPGGVSFGLAQAVVGRNRLIAYASGRSQMYGKTDAPDFSHVEGYEDHSVNLLYTWDASGELTGLLVNLAAPAQISRSTTSLSADYWHDTRVELRRRLGEGLFVLPQCSSAGDQDTNVLWDRKADERMLQLTGRNRRQDVAVRLADAACSILPVMRNQIEQQPVLAHRMRSVQLPRRILSEADVERALAEARPHQERFETMRTELEARPELRQQPDWIRDITRAYWHARRGQRVVERFELQKTAPRFPAEVHAVRIGEMAIVTNPFELYLDYGIQLKARSPAVQTFVVQLAGWSGYLPTTRAIAGGAYGAVPASTNVGPEGGRQLVEETLELLSELWN